MDAEKELKLKKVVFWELLAIALLVLIAVVVLLVFGAKRKAPNSAGTTSTGTTESSSSSTSNTTETTETTEETTETTETTTETTEETTETTVETTEETTEETVEQPSVKPEEPSVKPEEPSVKPEEPSEEESEETETPSTTPSTGTTPLTSNPIRPEDITQNGAYLTCQTASTVVGIDVSEWQGSSIDWAKVKAAGIDFVMIRAGYRGYESGSLNVDTYAQQNYEGASSAGLKIGVYFFSQAINVKEAEEEAAFVLNIIKGWKLDMPVVFDWEYVGANARTGSATVRTVTDCAKAFCNKIVAANLKPMIYFSESQARKRLYLSELADYDFWFVQYSNALDYPYKVDMWQYTDSGSVPGIKTNVDINLYFNWEE